jgi:hypothetical protein
MPRSVLEDAVRPYQLPDTAPATPAISQFSLASQAPIVITPGMGGSGAGPLPPINLGNSHFDETVTYYMDQAAVERKATET